MTTSYRLHRAIMENANQLYVFVEMLAHNNKIDKAIRKDAINMINVIREAAGEDGYYPGASS